MKGKVKKTRAEKLESIARVAELKAQAKKRKEKAKKLEKIFTFLVGKNHSQFSPYKNRLVQADHFFAVEEKFRADLAALEAQIAEAGEETADREAQRDALEYMIDEVHAHAGPCLVQEDGSIQWLNERKAMILVTIYKDGPLFELYEEAQALKTASDARRDQARTEQVKKSAEELFTLGDRAHAAPAD